MGLKRNGLVIAGLLVIVLVILVAPVSAEIYTINNETGALSNAIASAHNGDTIILNPGTYFESGIPVSADIIIESNMTYGGNRRNTIIDSQSQNDIFDVTKSFTIDNLTLKNLNSVKGAIWSNGRLNITPSTFKVLDRQWRHDLIQLHYLLKGQANKKLTK